jgi:hypothetical protein
VCPQPPDTGREVEVDLVEGWPEFLLGRGLEIPDAGEGDSGFGEGADLDQTAHAVRAIDAVDTPPRREDQQGRRLQ